MQVASAQFGTHVSLQQVLDRYSNCQDIIDHSKFMEQVCAAFLAHTRWARQSDLLNTFRDPGWFQGENDEERASQWYTRLLSQQPLGDESASQIPVSIYHSPFWAIQNHLPWRDGVIITRAQKRHARYWESR